MPELTDNLLRHINNDRMQVGNKVLNSAGTDAVSSSNPLSTDSTGLLQVSGLLPITQTTITEGVLSITGTGAADVMTQTLVSGSDATTWTKSGWIRVKVTDSGGRFTNGYHYIQVGTLT